MGIIHCNAREKLIKNIHILKQHFTGQSPFCIIPLSCNYKNPTSRHYICFSLFFVEYIPLLPRNHSTTSFYQPFTDQTQRFNSALPHAFLYLLYFQSSFLFAFHLCLLPLNLDHLLSVLTFSLCAIINVPYSG